ncbi:alpha/beta fold hydrolase [Streptomyces pini]|uniref:Pimeloyl-ACP methyl ester carboxylesterase n=1 Tax=Streptomyces pini TaxID=1520580 RepID=A0A1I3U782_9ACTN|nr:alpha/beta hydrolase [Streptomyces pini]SFJ78755.1 Pimeloyl-ACP methyl ester carboxylesterase [Streptomyces pini]
MTTPTTLLYHDTSGAPFGDGPSDDGPSGGGTPLVLLHSSVCDRRMWDPQWTPLAEAGHRLVRCDFRGHGDTPAATTPYRDADDVLALLDALDIGRTILVASSYGGRVALEFAARWPDRVTAMALLCPGMPGHDLGPELAAFDAREEALFEAGDLEGAVELNVAGWLGPEAGEAAREKVRRMQRHAFEVQTAAEEKWGEIGELPEPALDLSAITAPVLAVSGAHDLADFRTIAARLADLLPDARHLQLPWAGHLPNLERPQETTSLLTDFLRENAAQ